MLDQNTMEILVVIIIAAGIGLPTGRWFADYMVRKGWWK